MDTRKLVDPALLPVLDVFPTVALTDELLAPMREAERFAQLPVTIPQEVRDGVAQAVRTVPGPAGAPDITLTIYQPRNATAPLPCIYHIHGGGYVGGSAAQLEPLHRPAAYDLNCVIVSVDYRLAPENRFPASIEDCYAGLAWTFANASALGIDTARVGVMGESAGGGLAAALALLARDRGDYKLAFQHLIYPMLDDRTCVVQTPNPVAGEFIWTPHNNRFGWSSLLGHEPGVDDVSPYAAPARATDLKGLPPAFIACPTLDLFIDEDIDYAARLGRAGVAVELHVYPGGFHGFDIFGGAAPISNRARQDSREALRRALSA
ncbi:alpha/beta hydrolase [Candidatus Viadribacter manganicus]|uniref:Arylesterase n=1 Tax=Candidatus Viadribacter manganicus TaxID=1759059 RepID=A0A1B1AIT6_9PROT|nr:alpha/beta hydrolase [Candidatus Viadribacter manganicus]ANP46455.1 arylesterase [Candidatus Viadribacter manganicus]